MSSLDRRFFLCLLPALAGCGFTPIHGPQGSASTLRGRVSLAAPTDRRAFVLVGHLEDRLGLPQSPDYLLSYVISTDSRGLAISSVSSIERFNLNGTLSYTIVDQRSGARATSGVVRNFTSYSTTASTVSTFSAQRDAENRLMISLGDLLISQLLTTAPDWLS